MSNTAQVDQDVLENIKKMIEELSLAIKLSQEMTESQIQEINSCLQKYLSLGD